MCYKMDCFCFFTKELYKAVLAFLFRFVTAGLNACWFVQRYIWQIVVLFDYLLCILTVIQFLFLCLSSVRVFSKYSSFWFVFLNLWILSLWIIMVYFHYFLMIVSHDVNVISVYYLLWYSLLWTVFMSVRRISWKHIQSWWQKYRA